MISSRAEDESWAEYVAEHGPSPFKDFGKLYRLKHHLYNVTLDGDGHKGAVAA